MTGKATFVFLTCILAFAESSDSYSAQSLIAGTSGSPPATQDSHAILIEDWEVGLSFSVAAGTAYNINQLEVPVFHYDNPDPLQGTSAVFSVYADFAGKPGAELVTFSTDSITTTREVLSLTPSHPQLLMPGNRYWLTGRNAGIGQVNWIHGFFAFGEAVFRSDITPWRVTQGSNLPAFALLGTAVPEATTLMLIGVAGMIQSLRRFRT